MGWAIPNRRRWRRFDARIRARATYLGQELRIETLDVGNGGCALLMPCVPVVGTRIRITLECDSVLEPLRAAGTVAWYSTAGRCRAGVAFDEASHATVERWLQKYLRRNPVVVSRNRPEQQLVIDAGGTPRPVPAESA